MSEVDPKLKHTLNFSAQGFQGQERVSSGRGNRYHTFSTMSFQSQEQADSYLQDTGATIDSEVTPSWSNEETLKLSRRGSIVGMKALSDGSVKGFRFSSHATSRALEKDSETESLETYQQAATELATKATNSRGTQQSVNAVISDFGRVEYDEDKKEFNLFDKTHAMGVSGTGLDKSVEQQQKKQLYSPSIESMTSRGKKPNASQAYHSEPMAITFHDQQRQEMGKPSLRETGDNIGIMESYSNQICAQCAPMISQRTGTNSLVSGAPGLPFGGQKEGVVFPQSVTDTDGNQLGQAAVFRATPTSELLKDSSNLEQVGIIHQLHGPDGSFNAFSSSSQSSSSKTKEKEVEDSSSASNFNINFNRSNSREDVVNAHKSESRKRSLERSDSEPIKTGDRGRRRSSTTERIATKKNEPLTLKRTDKS